MICPRCKGSGKIAVIPKKTSKGWVTHLPCILCDGKTSVCDETKDWIELGKEMQSIRVGKRLTLRSAMKALNIKASTLSDMEIGKIKPDLTIYDNLGNMHEKEGKP